MSYPAGSLYQPCFPFFFQTAGTRHTAKGTCYSATKTCGDSAILTLDALYLIMATVGDAATNGAENVKPLSSETEGNKADAPSTAAPAVPAAVAEKKVAEMPAKIESTPAAAPTIDPPAKPAEKPASAPAAAPAAAKTEAAAQRLPQHQQNGTTGQKRKRDGNPAAAAKQAQDSTAGNENALDAGTRRSVR